MSRSVIAKRYSKALFNLAEIDMVLEKIEEDISEVAELFNASEDFQKVMVDTKVSMIVKEKIVKEFLEKLDLHYRVQIFVMYLLAKRRIMLLPDIARVLKGMVQDKLGKTEANLVVARPISETAFKQMTKQLSKYTGKTVTLNIQIDPEILGGVITRIGSVVIDGSLRHQLTRVYQSIIRG